MRSKFYKPENRQRRRLPPLPKQVVGRNIVDYECYCFHRYAREAYLTGKITANMKKLPLANL